MRSSHCNWRACVPLFWCMGVALVLSFEGAAVLATPAGCANCGCSCSLNACCNQCQGVGVPVGNQLVLVYIQPPCADSQYTACNMDGSNFSCATQTVVCYNVPKGSQYTGYPNPDCTGQPTKYNGPLQFGAQGCTSSGICGGA